MKLTEKNMPYHHGINSQNYFSTNSNVPIYVLCYKERGLSEILTGQLMGKRKKI